jgi:TonB family protein
MAMRHRVTSVVLVAVALLTLVPWLLSQEKNDSAASPTVIASSYPDTSDGLRLFLQDVLAAGKTGDNAKVAAFVKEMEIPNYQIWFPETFPEAGKSWVGPYGENLDRNERSLQELFVRFTKADGAVLTRKVNDSPQPGKGLEWGMLQALRHPVDIYFASWKQSDDAGKSSGEPIGYFMFIEGEFRWDSTVSFLKAANMSSSDQTASPSVALPSQLPPAEQQSQPANRIRVEPAVAAGLIRSRGPAHYPKKALDKRVQGKVNMLAIISKMGDVTSLRLIDGDPLLAPAAIDAVKQWKYRPYMVNGIVVEMETVVTYIFAIG